MIVQPAGTDGGTAESNPSVKVVSGLPTAKVGVKLVAPRLLLTLIVRLTTLPHTAFAGTANATLRLVERPLKRLP